MAPVLRRVGRFELIEEVGRGGMGVVYRARQTDLERDVAVKELPAFHATDATFVARFLRESRIAGSLQHPNIVTVYDYFEYEGVPYIAMEYVDRGSLRPLMRNLTLAQVAGVLEGMLAGLAHAETRGIVHRDMKPENLMVTSDGTIKIADFGIAKAFNQAAATSGFATRTGTTVGTPAYMAPEQAMAKDIGPWTDLYSAGVIGYELLTGKVPFYDTDTPVVVLMRQVNDPPPPPQSLNPSLDPAVCAWLERMLQKKPDDRYAGATEAWEAFEEIVIGVLGPRWRREARLLERGVEVDTPKPLTPAQFESITADTPPGQPAAATPLAEPTGFVTIDPRNPAPPVAPTPPSAAPPPPPPTPVSDDGFVTVDPRHVGPPPSVAPAAAAASAPAAASPAVETPPDGFVTIDPRQRPPVEAGNGAPPAAPPPAAPLGAAPAPLDAPPSPTNGDGFETYVPPGGPAPEADVPVEAAAASALAAEAVAPPPPPIVEPPVLPTPDIGISSDDGATIAPTSRPAPPKPPTPPRRESDGGGSRRGLVILAVLIALAIAGIAGAALLLGGGDGDQGTSAAASTPADTAGQSLDAADLGTSTLEASSADSVQATVPPDTAETAETAPETQAENTGEQTDTVETAPDTTGTEVPALADTPVKPKDRVTIAVSGGTIYVADPLGRVVTLDAGTMRRIELLEDAASPRAIVVGSGSVYIADSESVTRLRPDTLDQQNVEPFEGAVAMASDDGAPIAVVGKVGNRGRLCLVNADSLAPCAPLPFVPTGVGADSKGNVYVADGARGTVTSYGRRGGQFVARTPLEVGKGASGNIIVRGSTLYVAVKRGLAMVSGGQVAGTVQLPTTPGLIDVAETGFVFAPLPAASQVAVIDADDPLAEPQLVDVGRQPFSASAAGDLVYVADAADRSIARLDAATGESGGSTPVDALVKAPVKPIIARSLAATKNGLTTTGVLALQGGKLEASGFRLLDNDISDGTLSFELRSGGIGRGFETKALPDLGLNMTLQEFPGRVVATLRATKPFTSGTAKLAPNGRSVGITLVEPAPVVPNNDNNNNGSTGGGGGGGTPPPHTNTPPPGTSIDVG